MEAELGVSSDFRININERINKKNTIEESFECFSVSVPVEIIEAVSDVSGMTSFQNLINAHREREALRSSISQRTKLIEKRIATHAKKELEFQNMPEIEDEPVKEAKAEVEGVVSEKREFMAVDDDDSELSEVDVEEARRKQEEKFEKRRLEREKKKLAEEKKRAARQKYEAEKRE